MPLGETQYSSNRRNQSVPPADKIGLQWGSSSSNDIVTQYEDTVNNNFMQEDNKYSIPQKEIPSVLDLLDLENDIKLYREIQQGNNINNTEVKQNEQSEENRSSRVVQTYNEVRGSGNSIWNKSTDSGKSRNGLGENKKRIQDFAKERYKSFGIFGRLFVRSVDYGFNANDNRRLSEKQVANTDSVGNYSSVLDNVKELMEGSYEDYGEERICRKIVQFIQDYDEDAILYRFDRDSRRFVEDIQQAGKRRSLVGVFQDSGKTTYGGRLSSGNQQKMEGTPGIVSNESINKFSIPSDDINNYTETQYNNFGWVRYNDVLSAAEYQTLLSRYADYKHNKNKYPTTKLGQAVIYSNEYPDVIIYVSGNINKPKKSQVVRIIADSSTDISIIREEIISNEYEQILLPYENVQIVFGAKVLVFSKKRDFSTFQEHRAESKRRFSKGINTINREKQDGTRSGRSGEASSLSDSGEINIIIKNPKLLRGNNLGF